MHKPFFSQSDIIKGKTGKGGVKLRDSKGGVVMVQNQVKVPDR